MTEMKRITISVPDKLEQAIADLRKTERFCRSSYSEIMREMLLIGIENYNTENDERDTINCT